MPNLTILAISPHTDDAEMGAGGYLAALAEGGADVHAMALCVGDRIGGAVRDEFYAAMGIIGVPRSNLSCYVFESRYLPDRRQGILEEMIEKGERIRPDLVLVPTTMDTHQDHRTATFEAIRAFRETSVLGYELPWSNGRGFCGTFYVPLQEKHVETKLQAIAAYESQNYRHYGGDYVRHLARVRGGQIKREYAECYEVVRWVEHRMSR